MSVNNVSLRGGGRQPVVRKNLFSMHEDLTSWSQLLQDPEMMSTESDSQSISIPSVHQSIKSVSNKYRPLSMSFQQWQNSIAFPEETLESLQAPMENDFDIHRDLKSLAFKLQFVANLELQQDEERGLHVHGDQVLKNEIEKLISTTPTRMSSNETLGDPYSAKLDNILECEDESVVSSIAGSETSDATVPEENENNDYLHTKTLDDEASNAIGPDQSLTENEKVNIHLVHKMESTSIDDDLVAQPTVLSSAQDLSLVSEQEGTYTVYEEQDKTADHHEVFSDINEVFTIENSKEKIELEAVMESTSEEEHDKLVEKKIVTSSAISTTTVTSTDSLEVVSTVPIVVQTNNQNNTSEYTSVTPRSSLSCSDSRESIANEGDDARQSYNDQHQIDLQMDDELNSKDDVQSSNVITIEQNYDFTASNTATAETCVQISANQNKIDLEESSTSYEGINDPQNNIELAEKCTEHINEGFSCDLSDERKHSTGSTNFVDAQQKIFASQKVTTEQEIMPNEMDLLLYRPDRNTMEEENSYSEAAEVCSLASSSESFTVEVHHDDNETRKVVFSNDSSKLNLIEQDIEIAAHDLDGDISTSDAVKSTDVNHQSSVETVTKFGYNTDLQISCTQDIYDPAAEIVKSDATNAFHDPEQEEESTRMPSDDIVFVSEKAIERSTSPDMIHETYYVENMSEDNNEEETPHKVIVLEELPILSQEDANQAKSLKQIEIEEYTSVTKVTENQQMVSPKQIYVTEIKSHQEESIANSYPKKETAHFEQQKDNLFQKRHEARINVDEITLPEVTDNATNGLKTLSMGKIKADDPFKIDNEEPLQTETKTTVEADYHYQAIVTVQHEPAIENLCVESYQKVPIEKSSNLNAKISDDKACIVQDCEIVGKQINAYSSGSEDTAKFEKTPAVVSPQPERTEVQIPKTDEVDNRSSIVYEEDGGNFSVIEHKKALLSENIDNPCVISSQEEVCVEISYSISSETVVSNAIIQTKNSDLKDKCATSTTQQLVEKYNQVEAEKENTTLSLPLALSTDNKASSDIQETVSENTFNGDFKESEINLLKTVGFSNAETLEEKEDEVGVPPVHIGMRATSIAGQNKSAFQQKKSMFEKSPDCTTKHVPVYHSSPLKKFRTFNSPTSNDVDISRETPVVSARSSAESTVHQFSEPYTTNKEAIHQHKSPTSFFSAKPFSFSSIKAGHVAPIKRAFSPVSGKLKLKDSPTQQSLPQKPLSSTSSNDCHKPAVPPKPLTTSKPILSKVQSGVSCDKPAAESLPAIVSPKPWNHNLDTKSNIKKPKVIHPPDLSPFEKVKPDISHNLPVSFSSSTISNVTPLLPPAPDEEVLADLFSNEVTISMSYDGEQEKLTPQFPPVYELDDIINHLYRTVHEIEEELACCNEVEVVEISKTYLHSDFTAPLPFSASNQRPKFKPMRFGLNLRSRKPSDVDRNSIGDDNTSETSGTSLQTESDISLENSHSIVGSPPVAVEDKQKSGYQSVETIPKILEATQEPLVEAPSEADADTALTSNGPVELSNEVAKESTAPQTTEKVASFSSSSYDDSDSLPQDTKIQPSVTKDSLLSDAAVGTVLLPACDPLANGDTSSVIPLADKEETPETEENDDDDDEDDYERAYTDDDIDTQSGEHWLDSTREKENSDLALSKRDLNVDSMETNDATEKGYDAEISVEISMSCSSDNVHEGEAVRAASLTLNAKSCLLSSISSVSDGTMKPTMEDFVLPPPPPSDSDFTPHSNGTSSFNENQKSTTQESFRNPQNDDLPPPPPVLPVSPPPPTASGFFKSDKPKGFRKVARPVSKENGNSVTVKAQQHKHVVVEHSNAEWGSETPGTNCFSSSHFTSLPVTSKQHTSTHFSVPLGRYVTLLRDTRKILIKPINSNQGKEQTSSTYSIQGTSFPASQSADAHVTAKENLPDGAVYQTTSSDGDVVHTETYYPASEQGDAKTVVLERTKTTTIVQAPHHQGIGPVNDSGVPCALRTSVDDSKHWYKNMFKQMHKVEPHNDASARSGRRLSSNSGDDSHRHTSTEISKPTKVGRITDYQPAQPYVVENKPVKLNLNRRPDNHNVRSVSSNMNKNNNANHGEIRRSSSLEDFSNIQWTDFFNDIRKPRPDPIPTAVSYSNSSDKPATAKTSTKLHTNNAKASISETKKVMSSINKTTAKPQSTKDVEMRLPARAKFDFVPQTAKEYALKKGQTVIIAKKVDDNWYMVQSVDGSKSGIVPSTYVEVVSGSSPEKPLRNGHARAKFDLAGNSKNELSFKKGDEILLLKKVDANWYKAKLAGKTGIAPAVYLEVTMEPETSEKKDNTPNIVEHYVQSAKSESAQRNTSHSQQSSTLSQASSDEPDEKERKQRAAFLASTVVEAKVALHPSQKPSHREDFLDDLSRSSNAQERPLTAADDSSNNQVALNQAVDDLSNQPKNDIAPTTLIPSVPSYPSSNISTEPSSPHFPAPPATDYGQVIGCYVALYGYEASNDDELDLEPGDVVMVVETCDDGWYVGTCQRTGAFGTFPGNYVSLANST